MPSKQNLEQIAVLQEKVKRAKTLTVIDYSGTSANDQVALRRSIKVAGGELLVTKNTLLDIAVGKGKLSDALEGMNAFVFAYEDEVAPIKALFAFQKETEKLTIKKGVMADVVLSAEDLERLSKLPSKSQLVATLISRIQGPAYGLVNVLKAGQRDLVNVLHAIATKSS
jgi:large subunit ribosomal protein L10